MRIHCIYGVDYDSNIFVTTGENATIIDCGTGLHSNYVIEKIKEIISLNEIKQIVLTHEHYDHCGGIRDLYNSSKYKLKIFAHEKASDKIEKGESDFARMLGGEMPKIPVDVKLKDNEKIKIGDEDFQVLHTPGHTPGCICLYNPEDKVLFSGDTVFAYGSFGRYDFPGGSIKDLKKSIKRLNELDVLDLYPGHESIVKNDGNKHIEKSLENISGIF
jgi:glyoxylase-like metal-dependent hydrolase (beta-lactamase superfamily II)